ncbi:MAG: glycoside hydrolase family 127 protein [Bacillota bacterium]|nr:glycoside hydrolase family 127 protein [Bacillota bacterium]HHU62250.1 glycoside hydrolase family 127 protein [Natronincola sp.]
MDKRITVPCTKVRLKDGFLAEKARLIPEKVIPYQWSALNNEIKDAEPSNAIENFRIAAGESSGDFKGMVFQDSDLAKWLETVAFSLMTYPDEELEARADEMIALVAKAQQPNGYLNTFYTIVEPNKRWTNLRDNHELYCAGHFIEAAVAYYEATGKDELLQVICRFVDHIDDIFGPEDHKKKGYPGHQGIELALIKLYKVTNEKRHLDLAKFFVEERGQQPHYFTTEALERGDKPWDNYTYNQSHVPAREQAVAEGHSVRAAYFYSSLADLVLETDDQELLEVCEKLWDNTVNRQMYITGAIGSQEFGERFTIDYDLPNDVAYAETCASIALIFWAHRMLQIEAKGEYGDVLERALYNGVLSGMSQEGDRFFYVNPLEVYPDVANYRHDHRHVKTTRQEWFGCACCPPNISRLLASIHRYVYTQNEDNIYVHLFTDSELDTEIQQTRLKMRQETAYPRGEEIKFSLQTDSSLSFSLNIRIPQWCETPVIRINGKDVVAPEIIQGYVTLTRLWSDSDEVELILPMEVQRVWANPKVRENRGKVALQRGPIVYCLEEVDNGTNLASLYLPEETEFAIEYDEHIQMPVLVGSGYRVDGSDESLYRTSKFVTELVQIRAIPYFAWNNRGDGEMVVWINNG